MDAGVFCSGRRLDAVRIQAEAWIFELPPEVNCQAALPQTADGVWQTTLTAESVVNALLLPLAALPTLLTSYPQVSDNLSTACSGRHPLLEDKDVLANSLFSLHRLRWMFGLQWLQGRPASTDCLQFADRPSGRSHFAAFTMPSFASANAPTREPSCSLSDTAKASRCSTSAILLTSSMRTLSGIFILNTHLHLACLRV